MRLRQLILLLVAAGAAGQTPEAKPAASVPTWRIKFFHDRNDSAIDFNELVSPAAGTAYAFGAFAEDGKRPRGVLVASRDSGKSWETIKLPDLPVSADFTDASNGWLVVRDAVHRTTDGGVTWKRVAKLKGVLRVKFLNLNRGFAVGYPKAVWSTNDGGVSWAKVPEALDSVSRPENTTFSTISFATETRGLITGFSRPPRRGAAAPEWMDPEGQKPLVPNLMLVLETMDGGQTWKPQTVSVFGQVTKVVWGRGGFALMDFGAGFQYASEIVNLGDSSASFRSKDRAIKDIAYHDGRMWAAGTVVAGKLSQLPIPTRIEVVQSIDFKNWYSTPVDYRAVANRIKIAFGGKQGWLATDGGMILALE